ncbi:MAG: DNA polymerase IV [Desulfobacula sp.]|nr:DNA polymerase IV [Desulfobacula sp.]
MILHIDMDAFFAAIEQRDNPSLKGKPVIVAGKSKRSVVSTASYEARKFGIHSAMPVFQAREKCKHLIIVPGHMSKYQDNSKRIMDIFSTFSPVVEQVSIDEAYIDSKGCERLFGTPQKMAEQIKKKILGSLSLTCSIGIAPLKFLAKIASDMQKPDGLTIIERSKIDTFICQLPIGKVPGVGKQAMQQMTLLKVSTLGDIKKYPSWILNKKFGKMGPRLLQLANGIDNSSIQTHSKKKSISSETTLSKDISDFETVNRILLDRSQNVGRQLRKKNLVCRTVSIKLKFSDFSQITRSHTLNAGICASTAIFNAAVKLYKKIKLKKKIRLLGIGVSSLKDKDAPFQMQLMQTDQKKQKQWESVDSAIDSIDEKYGTHSVSKASLTKEKL